MYNSIQDYQDKYETDTESEALPLEYTMTFNGDSEVVEDGDSFAISESYDNDVLSTPVLSIDVADANGDVALAGRVTAEIVSNNTTFACAAVSSGNNTFNFRFTMPIGKAVNVYTGNVVIKITDTVLDVVSTVTAACTFTITGLVE